MRHFIIILLVFSSCQSDQSLFYTEIKEEYSKLINAEFNDISVLISRGQSLKSKMKSYLLEFPSGKNSTEIENWLNRLDQDLSDNAYNIALQKSKNIQSKSYDSYDQAIQDANQFIEELGDIDDYFYQESFITKIEKIISEQKGRIRILNQENQDYQFIIKNYRERYTTYEADNEISLIQSFIKKYENSIVRNELMQRIEGLHYTKFSIFRRETPQSIKEINDLISRVTFLLDKISAQERRDTITHQIQIWEEEKHEIFHIEWENKINELKNDMIQEAKNHCNKHVHDWCTTVISQRVKGCRQSDYLGKTTMICDVEVQAEGGIGCSKIYSVGYEITGNIEGDVHSGVRAYIDDVRFTYDRRN